MKKIRMSRVLAVALMLAMMVTAFVGCGGKKSDNEKIVGNWETTIDFQKALEDSMDAEDAGMLEGLDFSGITMKMTAQFKEDGTYALDVDKASAEDAMKQMITQLVPALKELIRNEIASASEIEPSEVTDEQLDQVLAFFGAESWDALGDLFSAEMDVDEVVKNINTSGKYLLKEGKLYMSTTPDGDPAAEEGSEYTLTDKTLTIKVPGDDVPEYMQQLTFNRVG